MSTDKPKEISVCIRDELSKLPDAWEKPSIFKLHGKQQSENKDAYEPHVVSIGPYHRDNGELMKMEKYKLKYLQELLKRKGEKSLEEFTEAMAKIQDVARSFYAEAISLDEGDFIKMLCLDGCFVIEFFRKLRHPEEHEEDDPIFQMSWLKLATMRDLILFENQLPFFVLHRLFEISMLPDEEKLTDLAIYSLSSILPGSYPGQNTYQGKKSHFTGPAEHEIVHLLGLMHTYFTASFLKQLPLIEDLERLFPEFKGPEPRDILQSSVIELLHSGTNFKLAKNYDSLFDITFKNGVIKIPPLFVDDHTESIFRNLIAYEQYMSKPSERTKCVTDYISLMDLLIDSPSDVEKLRTRDIIMHGIGSDKAVSAMFNKMSSDVSIDKYFCYTKILLEVREHSRNRCHRWTAILRRNHLNTPWAITSVLAAFFLILLTTVQTIFSILQFTSDK